LSVVAPKSAEALHEVLAEAALHAPMQFFQKTPIGSIINRFSSDMTVVDIQLPLTAWSIFTSKSKMTQNSPSRI
jgi:ATP-binding cassette subfamily C (CFTR/MRP) protein 1